MHGGVRGRKIYSGGIMKEIQIKEKRRLKDLNVVVVGDQVTEIEDAFVIY